MSIEGDVVLGSFMPLIIGVGGALIGGVFVLLKWFSSRLLSDIDKRLARIDDLERRFEQLIADLPLHYQRKEDAVRELTTINAKLDRLYELLVRGGKNK